MEGMDFFPMCKLISVFCYYILKKGNYMFHNMQENYPRDSAAVAGDRNFDVYMGVDVFGRNTFGGGKWNVCLLLILWDAWTICFGARIYLQLF